MQLKNELLLASAARLYSLGLDLDGAVETLRSLVTDGLSFDSPEMSHAYHNYVELRQQFESLEKDFLRLRESM